MLVLWLAVATNLVLIQSRVNIYVTILNIILTIKDVIVIVAYLM